MESDEKPIRFVLYFPLGNKSDERSSDLLLAVEDFIAQSFGGLTSYPATGLFSAAGKIQRERVQVLEAFADPKAWSAAGETVQRLGSLLARRLHQEAVAISVDGVLSLKDCEGGMEDAGSTLPEQLSHLLVAQP